MSPLTVIRLSLLLGLLACGRASGSEMPGFPHVQAFTDREMFGNEPPATESVAQLPDGRLIFANKTGLFALDGRSWKRLHIEPEIHDAMTIGNDAEGRVWVSSFREIGYLSPLVDGTFAFVSIRPFLPPEFATRQEFFWPTAGRDGMYFHSFYTAFRWDGKNPIEGWETSDVFPYLVKVGDEVLISVGMKGLYRAHGRELELVPGSETGQKPGPRNFEKVTGAAPYRDGWVLMTQSDGFRFYDGKRVTPIEVPASRALRSAHKTMIRFRAAANRGYVSMDNRSRLLFYDAALAITDEWTPQSLPGLLTGELVVDRDGQVWTGLNDGVLRISRNDWVRVLDTRAEWPGDPIAAFHVGDRTFVSAGPSTIEWVPGKNGAPGSTRVSEEFGRMWHVQDGDVFYSDAPGGVMLCKYRDGSVEQLLPEADWKFTPSIERRDVVYVERLPSQMGVLEKQNGRWRLGPRQTKIPLQFADCADTKSGFWLTLGEGRIARASKDPFFGNVRTYDHLPSGWVRAFAVGNDTVLSTNDGMYRFDEATDTFRPDPRFSMISAEVSRDVRWIQEQPGGNIWISTANVSGILRPTGDGSYTWDVAALSSLNRQRVNWMGWDDRGWMWCRTATEMFAVRPDAGAHRDAELNVRLIELRDLRSNRLLLGEHQLNPGHAPTLPHANNALELEVSAPEFVAPSTLEFQFWVEGLEPHWSSWQSTPIRRLVDLSAAQYTLHYRARNAFGHRGEGAPFTFTIARPWYRSWPAYLSGLVASGGLIWGGVALYSRQLRRRNAHLERLVADRTRDLEATQRALVEASYSAGRAEVATSVLHNIGNVLNSVNISATLIGERCHKLAQSGIVKLAELIRPHRHDLADYLTRDEKGKRVPEFVDALAAQVQGEARQLGGEIDSLKENIEHIKDIVAAQQAHANVGAATEALDPREVFDDALRLAGASAAGAAVRFVREFGAAGPVRGHRAKLLQILVSLLRHARSAGAAASATDRVVTVKLRQTEAGVVQFVVAHNGPGLAADDVTRIFALEFGAKAGGRTLELHAAANAAQEMNGRLWAESAGPHAGAAFLLEMPAAADRSKPRDASATAVAQG